MHEPRRKKSPKEFLKLARRLKLAADPGARSDKSKKYSFKRVPRWNVYTSGSSGYRQGQDPDYRPLLKTKGTPGGVGNVYANKDAYKRNVSLRKYLSEEALNSYGEPRFEQPNRASIWSR